MYKPKYHQCRTFCILFLGLATFLFSFGSSHRLLELQAKSSTVLNMEDAYKLALAGNTDYKNLTAQISAKEIEYEAAVKAVRQQNITGQTPVWSPLLNFELPEGQKLSEEFEYTYKPFQLQTELSGLNHKLQDTKYSIREEVTVQYAGLYEEQQTIYLKEMQLAVLEKRLDRVKSKVFIGKASAEDADTLQSSVDTLAADIASAASTLASDKEKLGKLVQMDLSEGYVFENPYELVTLSRTDLQTMTAGTLDADQTFYEMRLDTGSKLLAIKTNYSLMQKQYGDRVTALAPYIEQADEAEKINLKALKTTYDGILADLENDWEGNVRILSISVTKEWLKGETSGIRYIEDDPYVLYTAFTDYQKALADQNTAEQDLRQSVTDAYNGLVKDKNTYLAAEKSMKKCKTSCDQAKEQYNQGNLTDTDYEKCQDQYYESRLAQCKAFSDYSKALYSFNRLTCNGVTDLALEEGERTGQDVYLTANMVDGAYYYIQSMVENNSFSFGIYVPENYEIDVTAFELWVDGIQIGTRTEINQTIVHLNFSTGGAQNVFVRLYNGEEFVDDCSIDPTVYSGKLPVTGSYRVESSISDQIGTFTYTTNGTTKITTISIALNEDEKARTYVVKNAAGIDLLSGKKVNVEDGFSYLNLAIGSLDELKFMFYDKFGNYMYSAHLNSKALAVTKDTE